MSQVLEVIWLPAVEAEYRALLRESRDVGADVGSQFGEFVQLTQQWNRRDWHAVSPVGSAYLYGLYGIHATMFFAVCEPKAAVVKWAVTGTEHEQSVARDEAVKRTLNLFP
jgi:hypothetical protein